MTYGGPVENASTEVRVFIGKQLSPWSEPRGANSRSGRHHKSRGQRAEIRKTLYGRQSGIQVSTQISGLLRMVTAKTGRDMRHIPFWRKPEIAGKLRVYVCHAGISVRQMQEHHREIEASYMACVTLVMRELDGFKVNMGMNVHKLKDTLSINLATISVYGRDQEMLGQVAMVSTLRLVLPDLTVYVDTQPGRRLQLDDVDMWTTILCELLCCTAIDELLKDSPDTANERGQRAELGDLAEDKPRGVSPNPSCAVPRGCRILLLGTVDTEATSAGLLR